MAEAVAAQKRPHPFCQLKPLWPVEELKSRGLWFNNVAITGYPSANSVDVEGHGSMDLLGSYGYLGLNLHPEVVHAVQQAVAKYGTGCHGVRMLAGTLDLHLELEAEIAALIGTEDCVVFSSGYAANLSTLGAVLTPDTLVIADKLIHASLVDGVALSGARMVRFRHNDPSALLACLESANPRQPILIIVDGVYSMEGDVVHLQEILQLAERFGAALMVDEAHSFAVLGQRGAGVCDHFSIDPRRVDVLMGTLSKALPSSGGYVAGSRELCSILRTQGRGFVYSGALSPANTAAALASLKVLKREPERLTALRSRAEHFAEQLSARRIPHIHGGSPIVPVLCGSDMNAWEVGAACRRQKVFVQAIISPVVPSGTARLRSAVNCNHSFEDLERFAGVIADAFDECGLAVPVNTI